MTKILAIIQKTGGLCFSSSLSFLYVAGEEEIELISERESNALGALDTDARCGRLLGLFAEGSFPTVSSHLTFRGSFSSGEVFRTFYCCSPECRIG